MSAEPATQLREVYVGRQPIYDRRLDVFAYELLFRRSGAQSAGQIDGDLATYSVILNTFLDIGIERIVGPHRAFINLTRNFLLSDQPLPFSPDRVVLEVLENIKIDDAVIRALRARAAQGYWIALDDFIFHEHLRPLVELAHIVKIDVLGQAPDEIARHVKKLREYPVRLLAEKVETQEMFEYCRSLNFEYYQGYFFCRPKIIKGHRVPINRIAVLRLIAKLQNPDTELEELVAIISQDILLSFKLLRYINSAAFSLSAKIESIRQAVVYLGYQPLRTWATLVALAGIEDKPSELMVTAIVRAKMCALLAQHMKLENEEMYFIVGLFSALDAMMDMSMAEVLENLPLADTVRDALLERAGVAGRILDCVLAYERGDWDQIQCFQIETELLSDSYLKAISWADEVTQGLLVAH